MPILRKNIENPRCISMYKSLYDSASPSTQSAFRRHVLKTLDNLKPELCWKTTIPFCQSFRKQIEEAIREHNQSIYQNLRLRLAIRFVNIPEIHRQITENGQTVNWVLLQLDFRTLFRNSYSIYGYIVACGLLQTLKPKCPYLDELNDAMLLCLRSVALYRGDAPSNSEYARGCLEIILKERVAGVVKWRPTQSFTSTLEDEVRANQEGGVAGQESNRRMYELCEWMDRVKRKAKKDLMERDRTGGGVGKMHRRGRMWERRERLPNLLSLARRSEGGGQEVQAAAVGLGKCGVHAAKNDHVLGPSRVGPPRRRRTHKR
ncbi:hypothetical protein HDV00_002783 [Rhizophlyctis rosea]|nr:hypothetical protein HDV00_002783 [Rhizophlyctis rosea]